ncbi:hypothetical protein JCM19047_3029 [Bacillus sp. JCM 19047]|nr:hypothetical protein JCM19047_3029 [Bacillus sp. JCM 19047]
MNDKKYAQALWIVALVLAFAAVFIHENCVLLLGIVVCVVCSTFFYVKSKNK